MLLVEGILKRFFFCLNSISKTIKQTVYSMKPHFSKSFFISLLILCSSVSLLAQETFVYGDALPDAPELSPRGTYMVGVRSLQWVHKNQVDILKRKDGIDPLYDRPLSVEVWYPANHSANSKGLVTYSDVLGTTNDPKRPLIPFSFLGRAERDASPNLKDGAFPLVIVSHGYLGSSHLMTYLTENLASKGYVVVAIDHTESTHKDGAAFQSTLLNRSKDILFVLNQMAEESNNKNSFLKGLVNANQTALIGYSMGGYGVLNVAGAGYSQALVSTFVGMTNGSKAIEVRSANSEVYTSSIDSRIKAVVAFAPWGMQRGVWDAEGLKGLKVPTFFVAGDQDDISGYDTGIKAIYTGAINAERFLLTYKNARHNVAPNPPPVASLQSGVPPQEYMHYSEPAWDEKKINNINQHFVTAFLGTYLKQLDYKKYLTVEPNSNTKTWTGFKPRTGTGLELLSNSPQK